jgi:hypothetical protein
MVTVAQGATEDPKMKITTVLAAFAVSSLFATGVFAQTMQPIPNPPEPEHPARHVTHHHVHHRVVHHVHHVANTGGQTGTEQQGGAAPTAPPKSGQNPK